MWRMLRVGRILICVHTTNKDCLLLLRSNNGEHDFFWAGDGGFPVQPPGRDREQGKGESAHAGRGQFGCRARAVGKARAGKPSTRAGFQKERSATAKQAPRRPSSQVRLAGKGKPAMQSAQTRKLRLWERVRQRYSGRLRGYATKPVRPIQTSYARLDGRMLVTATQSAQTRKLRLWERVQQRYSTKLSGYATKPVRPIQTSYARADDCSPANSTCTECPNPQVTLMGWGTDRSVHNMATSSAGQSKKKVPAYKDDCNPAEMRLNPPSYALWGRS